MDLATHTSIVMHWMIWGLQCFLLITSINNKAVHSSQTCSINGTNFSFDPTNYICCQGKMNARTNDNKLYCCGEELYSPASSICCNNVLKSISTTNVKPRCCQDVSYDANEFFCCQGKLRKKIVDNPACCDGKLFDVTNHICCGGRIQNSSEGRSSCCGSNSYNTHKDTCCKSVLHLNTITKTCCGTQVYHPSLSTCCNGYLTNKPRLSCCHHLAYNKTTSVCCGRTVRIREAKNIGCCCSKNCTMYNKDRQICCGGSVVRKQSHLDCCGTDIYDVTLQVCCGQIPLGATSPSNWRCCDGKPYNDDNQICCKNVIHPRESRKTRCCGNRGYEPSRFQCEDFVYSRIIPINGEYCGDKVYNSDREMCCIKIIVPKMYGWLSQCCGQTVYHRQRQLCCAGVITSIPGGIPQCCGTKAINILQQKCDVISGVIVSRSKPHVRYCGSKMVEFDPMISGCCGDVVYGHGHICCHGEVKLLPGNGLGQFKCCREKPYNESYTCCHGNLVSKNQATKCCGEIGYTSSTHACCQRKAVYSAGYTCCKGVVHPTPGTGLTSGKCCREIGYNSRSQICCGDMIFPKTSEKMKCCGDRPYDPSRNLHICCHASLSLGSHGRRACCGRESFNPSLQTCCKRRVHRGTNASCCRTNIFDPRREICCGRNVYPIVQYGTKCCRKLAYDDTKQVCQAGKVMTRMFCGDKLYDDVTQLCCGERLYAKLADYKCCNKRTYNDLQSICCGKKIYRKNQICCDGRAYGGKTFECCGGKLIKKRYFLKCCKGRVYDKRRFRCRRDRIVVKDRLRRKLCEPHHENVVFLGKVTSVASHSFEIQQVFTGKQLRVKSTITVPYKKLHRKVAVQLGKAYLLIGRVANNTSILKHVKMCHPWRANLQPKVTAILKSCGVQSQQRFFTVKRSKTYNRQT